MVMERDLIRPHENSWGAFYWLSYTETQTLCFKNDYWLYQICF